MRVESENEWQRGACTGSSGREYEWGSVLESRRGQQYRLKKNV